MIYMPYIISHFLINTYLTSFNSFIHKLVYANFILYEICEGLGFLSLLTNHKHTVNVHQSKVPVFISLYFMDNRMLVVTSKIYK